LGNAVGVESPRGFKIGKAAAARKIDLVVALAMSALAAVRHERSGWGMLQYTRQVAEAYARGETPVEDTSLADEYWKVRNELEQMSENSICPKCKKPLGATKTLNTDGRYDKRGRSGLIGWCAEIAGKRPTWGGCGPTAGRKSG
jgi:hypothetical protein